MGQRVLVRNMREGPRWVLGTVVERKGPLSYLVEVASGAVWKRHVDHLLESVDSPREELLIPGLDELPQSSLPTALEDPRSLKGASLEESTPSTTESRDSVSTDLQPVATPPRRYPQRERRPSDRYQPSF